MTKNKNFGFDIKKNTIDEFFDYQIQYSNLNEQYGSYFLIYHSFHCTENILQKNIKIKQNVEVIAHIIKKNALKIKFRTFSYLEKLDNIYFMMYEEIL